MQTKIRPSYRYTWGKFKGKTVAETPKWYNCWSYQYADNLTEPDRYIIAQYIGKEYQPRKKNPRPF